MAWFWFSVLYVKTLPLMFTCHPSTYLKSATMVCILLYSTPSVAQRVPIDTVDKMRIDSLISEVGRLNQLQRDSLLVAIMERYSWIPLSIPAERIKNQLLIKSQRELPGNSFYLPLPDDWKDIDPFARNSMIPKLPEPYKHPLPSYAIYTKGIDGYYFAMQEMGYYGTFSPDTVGGKKDIGLNFYVTQKEHSPTLNRIMGILGVSKNVAVVLAVVLQALLL